MWVNWKRFRTSEEHQVFKYWLILYVLTFFLFLPVLGFVCRYTVYDKIIPRNSLKEKHRLIAQNTKRYNQSIAFLNKLKTMHSSEVKSGIVEGSINHVIHNMPSNPTTVTVTIITVSRNRHSIEDYEPNYLTQVVAEFLKLAEHQRSFSVQLTLCNVDSDPASYDEIRSLPSWIPVFQRFDSAHILHYYGIDEKLEKEKQDYVYCLEQSLLFNTSYVLLVEDDALPHRDLFPVLDVLISRDLQSPHSPYQNVTYVKLYHPDRLLGYINLEVERLPELLALSLIVCTISIHVYARCINRYALSSKMMWIVFFVYATLFLVGIGRQNLLELRRLSSHLYQVTPSPSCCTPAMLFTHDGGKMIANYLKTVRCKANFAKDTAIDKFRKEKKLVAKCVQPNLFTHIGQFSSLRAELVDPFVV